MHTFPFPHKGNCSLENDASPHQQLVESAQYSGVMWSRRRTCSILTLNELLRSVLIEAVLSECQLFLTL